MISELIQVKASAGSGKTYSLTGRFLELMEKAGDQRDIPSCGRTPIQGYSWPEILAVTFTNKAAAEMKERVVRTLKLAALDIDGQGQKAGLTGQQAGQALESILRRSHQLNIRTIDSLLNLLLRLFALDLKMAPDFELIFDQNELYEPLFERFISKCEAGTGPENDLLEQALETLLVYDKSDGFWLRDKLKKKIFTLLNHLNVLEDNFCTDQKLMRDLLARSLASYKKAATLLSDHIEIQGLSADKRFLNFLSKTCALDIFDSPSDSAYAKKSTLSECMNKSSKDITDKGEALFARFKDLHAEHGRVQAILSGAHSLAPSVTIAKGILEDLKKYQRRHGLILGSSLAGMVRERLSGDFAVPDAFCRMGGRLQHLLIDEFQDTGRDQWKAVTPLAEECLSKGGSLFYVGDVKQAIYGWRGGDSNLFDEVMGQPGLAEVAASRKTEPLECNWRSSSEVVEFNNEFFGKLEDEATALELAEVLLSGAPAEEINNLSDQLARNFSNSRQKLPDNAKTAPGYVCMESVPGGSAEEIQNQSLDRLEELLEEVLTRRKPGEVAVLVRSHAHAALVCERLVSMNLPMITENSLLLSRHPAVRQLAAFMAWLDYPQDNLAFMEFITGPDFSAEAGLDTDQLHCWLVGQTKSASLSGKFRDDFPEAWRLIKPFYAKSGLMTPYDLVREMVVCFRLLERDPQAGLYVLRFLEIVHLAEEKGHGSLSTFLEFWTDKGREEKVPLPENVDAVRIITIHKAKGLEFPVVMIPFHHWMTPTEKGLTSARLGDETFLTAAAKALGAEYYAKRRKELREQLNLLYVAWTRPREELYGIFPQKGERGGLGPVVTTMTHLLELDAVGETFERGARPKSGKPRTTTGTLKPRRLPLRDNLPEFMGWLPRLRVFRHSLEDFSQEQRMRGELAHKALELLKITGEDVLDSRRAVFQSLDQFPALPRTEELEKELNAMLLWVLALPGMKEMLAKGRSEPEMLDAEGGVHRADHLYSEPGKSIVLEYKTGQPSPDHLSQVRGYLRLLRDIHGPDHRLSGLIIYLDRRETLEVGL